MTSSRAARIWGLVAEQAASRGAGVSVTDVCMAAVAAIGASGVSLTAASIVRADHVMCVTDEVSERLEELQLTLGEGPRADAYAAGGPVLISDLADSESQRRWPGFAPAARQAGAGAIFAFPLQIGVIRAGVLSLYRTRPGPLGAGQLGDALVFADIATVLLLDGQHQPAGSAAVTGPGGQPEDLALHRAEIDQATGMLTEQLGASIEEAFVRLRAYAYAHDRRITEVARDIVARRLRLRPDPVPPGEGPAGTK
jgi:ANTAR domain-containing protein